MGAGDGTARVVRAGHRAERTPNAWLSGLPVHVVVDQGRLVAAHARVEHGATPRDSPSTSPAAHARVEHGHVGGRSLRTHTDALLAVLGTLPPAAEAATCAALQRGTMSNSNTFTQSSTGSDYYTVCTGDADGQGVYRHHLVSSWCRRGRQRTRHQPDNPRSGRPGHHRRHRWFRRHRDQSRHRHHPRQSGRNAPRGRCCCLHELVRNQRWRRRRQGHERHRRYGHHPRPGSAGRPPTESACGRSTTPPMP